MIGNPSWHGTDHLERVHSFPTYLPDIQAELPFHKVVYNIIEWIWVPLRNSRAQHMQIRVLLRKVGCCSGSYLNGES
jgi:hypothetical protein